MESAIQKAALSKFSNDNNIEVIIDRESGEIKIQKFRRSRNCRKFGREITLEEAKKSNPKNKDLKVGEKFLRNYHKLISGDAAQSANKLLAASKRSWKK